VTTLGGGFSGPQTGHHRAIHLNLRLRHRSSCPRRAVLVRLNPETINEARVAERLVNSEGDVIWTSTQESKGAKSKGASAEVADKGVQQLIRDVEKLAGTRPKPRSLHTMNQSPIRYGSPPLGSRARLPPATPGTGVTTLSRGAINYTRAARIRPSYERCISAFNHFSCLRSGWPLRHVLLFPSTGAPLQNLVNPRNACSSPRNYHRSGRR
jgi:hypothetical protein